MGSRSILGIYILGLSGAKMSKAQELRDLAKKAIKEEQEEPRVAAAYEEVLKKLTTLAEEGEFGGTVHTRDIDSYLTEVQIEYLAIKLRDDGFIARRNGTVLVVNWNGGD